MAYIMEITESLDLLYLRSLFLFFMTVSIKAEINRITFVFSLSLMFMFLRTFHFVMSQTMFSECSGGNIYLLVYL